MTAESQRAAHYAAALAALGRAAELDGRLDRDVAETLDLLAGHAMLDAAESDARIAPEGRRAILRELLGETAHPIWLGFLETLASAGDWHLLRDIAAAYFEERGRLSGGLAGEIASAYPLDENSVRALEEAVRFRLGRPVRLHVRIRPELVGGVAVRVGDWLIDGTVLAGLKRMREALTA